MTKTMLKKPIIIGISVGLVILLAVGALVFLRPKAPDPEKLLADADRLSEQNLCLMALLQQEPENEEYLRQLLLNYQILGADPLTIQATRGDHLIELPKEVTLQPEEPGKLLGVGGLVQNKQKITDYKGAGAVATDGETVYLAKEDGIFAVYHGLELKLSPARADRLMPTENGLYFLNTVTKRVQYIAKDGHKTETLSAVPATDLAFHEDSLWVAGADGGLYRGDELADESLQYRTLCAVGGRLYAATAEGIAEITENGTELLLPSPVAALTAGESVLYYIDENGYPARFDPETMEATILKEKTATALCYDEGRLYYLSAKGKLKRINKK